MDTTVTLDWINSLNLRHLKLKKLSDVVIIDYLVDLLIKFEFCPREIEKSSNTDKQDLIIKFLKAKNKQFDTENLFTDDRNLQIACWVFLIHIVWGLEDATLRNHLSLNLNNSSQVFIKNFLESIQSENVTKESISNCLHSACEKSAHLEQQTEEYYFNSSFGSTPNYQTPTGIRKKTSLTLREFFQSPNSQKKFVEEHTKEIRRLKMELNAENIEKTEMIEENGKLRTKMDTLNKQLQHKINENEKLKEQLREMEVSLQSPPSPDKRYSSEERDLSFFKIEVSQLKEEVLRLENENETIAKKLLVKERKIAIITEEFSTVRAQLADLELMLIHKDELLNKITKDKEFMKTEMENLKEYNQTLQEKVAALESIKPVVTENPENLERELQFQLMKDSIECMTKNIVIIENEQARVISENATLSEQVKNLTDEKITISTQIKELNTQLENLKKDNDLLKNQKDGINKKLGKAETKVANIQRDFENTKNKYKTAVNKLNIEKEESQKEISRLSHDLEHQLKVYDELKKRELSLIEGKKYLETSLLDNKDRISKMENRLEEFNLEIEKLKGEKFTLSKKICDLENQNKIANNKIVELNKEKNKLQKIRDELDKKVEINKETIESLVKQVSTEQDRYKELNGIIEEKDKLIQSIKNDVQKFEDSNVDLNKKINVLKDELQFTHTRYRYEADGREKLDLKLNDLEKFNESQKVRIQILDEDIKNKISENKSLVRQVKDKEEFLKQTENKNEKLTETLKDVAKEKEDFRKKYIETKEKLSENQEFIQTLTNQLSELQNDHEKLSTNHDRMLQKLEITENQFKIHETDKKQLTQKIEDLSKEVEKVNALYHDEMENYKILNSRCTENIHLVNNQKTTINNLENKLKSAKKKIESLTSELKEIHDNLSRTRDDYEKSTEEVINLKEEKNILLEKISHLESSLEETQQGNTKLNDVIENVIREKSELQNESEIFKSKISELVVQVSSLNENFSELNQNNETLVTQLSNIKSEMEVVEKEKIELKKRCNLLDEQIACAESYRTQETETRMSLTSKLANLERINKEQKELIESLESDLKQASLTEQELQECLKEKEKAIIDFNSQLQELTSSSTNLKAEKQSLSEEIESLKSQNQSLTNVINELTQIKQKDANQYELNITVLTEEIANVRNQIEDLSRSNESQLKTLQLAENQLKESESQRELLSQQCSQLKEEKEHIYSLRQNEGKASEELNIRIGKLEKLNAEQQTQIKILENDFKNSTNENERLQEELKNLSNKSFEIQECLKASSQETETLRHEKQLLLEKITGLENNLMEMRIENKTLSEKVSEITDQHNQLSNERNDFLVKTESTQAVIETLNNEITQLKRGIEELTAENRKYHSELEDMISCLDQSKKEKLALEIEQENLIEKMNEAQMHYENELENNVNLKLQIDEQKQINTEQCSQIDMLKERLNVETTKLIDRERELQQALETKDSENKKFKTENEKLLAENDKFSLDMTKTEELIELLKTEKKQLLETLETKENELQEVTIRSHNELQALKIEREADAKRIADLMDNCKVLTETTNTLKKELEILQQEYEKLDENKNKSMNELRDMFLQKIDHILITHEQLKTKNQQLSESNRNKLWYLRELQKKMEPILRAVDELEVQIKELKTKNDALTKEIEEFNENKYKFKKENERLRKLIVELEKEKDRLSKELQNLKEEKDLFSFKIEELKKDNDDMRNDTNRLRRLMRKESSDHEILKKEAEKLSANIKAVQTDNEKLLLENDELKDFIEINKQEQDVKMNSKNSEIENVKSNLNKVENELTKLKMKQEQLTQENEKLLEERSLMMDQKLLFEQENVELKRQLDELMTQKSEIYEINEQNRRVFENLQQSLNNEIQELKNTLEQYRVNGERLENENESLKHEISVAKENASNLVHQEIANLQKRIDLLADENGRLKNSGIQFNKEIASLSTEKIRLDECIKKLSAENHSFEIKIQTFKEIQNDKKILQKRVEQLKIKIDESLEENEKISKRLGQKIEQHDKLVMENEHLLDKLEKLEFIREKVLTEKEKLKDTHSEMLDKIESLNENLTMKEQELNLLKDEYRIFKDEYRKLSQHKDELGKDFKETLLTEFKSVSNQCDELKAKIEEKNRTITALMEEIEKMKTEKDVNLNETHVVASGVNNKSNIILVEENQRLQSEIQQFKKKVDDLKTELEKEKENYRNKTQKLYNALNTKFVSEYEGKLERAKKEYREMIHDKLEMREKEWKKKEEEYRIMLTKEKEHIKELSAQLWTMSDKYLGVKQKFENRLSPASLRRFSIDNNYSPGTLFRRSQSASNLNLMDSKIPKMLDFDRRLSTMSEDFPMHSKNRKTPAIISGKKFLSSAKVFPTADEEMEIFDNACLSDLKQGRMPSEDDINKRLSVLQARNSLCPPHLKSSYPAETQFLPLQEFKENDIKMGCNDNTDIENLLPSERLRRNRNQTSYKKPGPPTPSKNGGRSSNTDCNTPRNVLKDSNDNGTARRKSFTPRLFNIFPMRGHATVTTQDENTSVTPKRSRLQSIRRRFSKSHQELGNTNSGFC